LKAKTGGACLRKALPRNAKPADGSGRLGGPPDLKSCAEYESRALGKIRERLDSEVAGGVLPPMNTEFRGKEEAKNRPRERGAAESEKGPLMRCFRSGGPTTADEKKNAIVKTANTNRRKKKRRDKKSTGYHF